MLNLATESSKMDGSVDRSLCEKLSHNRIVVETEEKRKRRLLMQVEYKMHVRN